jgi:predicted dehydrogenase
MSRPYRVAILGLGHWYSAYGLARSLREYPRADLVAAAWTDARQLDEFAHTFGIRAYANYGELLARESVDIVHIAAPVVDIPELTVESARAGKHIIVGKPIAMDLASADRMVGAVEAAGVACVAFQGVTRLRFAALKQRLDAGEIGDLILLHQTSRWSIAEDWERSGTPGWFADPRKVPGGAFIDEGIYWIDLFRWLSASDVVSVEAKVGNLVHKDIAVEDWGMATFTMANGIIATLEASWTINAPRKSGPSPKQNSVVRLEVVGSRGEIIEQWFRDPGRAVLAAGAENWIFERAADPFAQQTPALLDRLIDCIERKTPASLTIQDARASLAVALAAYRAAREGHAVRLGIMTKAP